MKDDTINRQTAIDLANELYQGTDIIQTTYDEVRKAIVAFINLVPSAQPDSKETSSTHKALDAISRQAAIEAVKDAIISAEQPYAEDALRKLPSAQPEKRTKERTETHACDLVSRQAAINEITEYGGSDIVYMSVGELKRRLEQLPSAQPEVRTQMSSADCISRQEAIDAFRQELVFDYEEQCTTFAGIKKILEALPSVQMDLSEFLDKLWKAAYEHGKDKAKAEIVRCKDCKRRDYCRTSTTWAVTPSDDWFCADAERREE